MKRLDPDIIVNLPTPGFPRVPAVNAAINEAFDKQNPDSGNVDAIAIMVYQESTSLDFVANYARGRVRNAVNVRVPLEAISVGCKGSASADTIQLLTSEVSRRGLRGLNVWYSSVINGFQYEPGFDVKDSLESRLAFKRALDSFNGFPAFDAAFDEDAEDRELEDILSEDILNLDNIEENDKAVKVAKQLQSEEDEENEKVENEI